ncbi:MAG: hypothetical protein ACM31C_14085 [Acidobacteriota bacterium]
MKTEALTTIDRDLLVTATGGAGKPKPPQPPQPPRKPDYADEYVNTVWNDAEDTARHANASINAFHKGNYGQSAKEFGKYMLDGMHTASDMVFKPVKDFLLK